MTTKFNAKEIEILERKWDKERFGVIWTILFLLIIFVSFLVIRDIQQEKELSSVPHKVCENETNIKPFCNSTCIYQWSRGYNYSKNKNYPEYPEMMAPKVCRESGDIIYEDYVDNSNLSICYVLNTDEFVYCNQPAEVRSCKHKGIATIYIKNGYTDLDLNVSNSIKYLRNNQTNEIYRVKDGIVDLSFVKPYETIVLTNVSQEVVNVLDKLEEVCHYE